MSKEQLFLYGWHLESTFVPFFLILYSVSCNFINWFIFLSHASLLFFLSQSPSPLLCSYFSRPEIEGLFPHVSIHVLVHFHLLFFFSPFSPFFTFFTHAPDSPSLSFGSIRSFDKSNLFGNFCLTCSVAWCQLFLVPLVKPGFMERIQKGHHSKDMGLSSSMAPDI